jgi:RHS repeat-associated protein
MAYANPDAVAQIANGLSTTSISYDQDGNLSQKTVDGTTTTYLYDYANRLIAIGSQGATTTYGYDAFGTRVLQTGASTTTWYPFKWYSVASSTGTGAKFSTTTEYVFNSDSLVATVDQQTAGGNATGSPATHYIHPDHLGSTNVVTNPSGNVEQTFDYLPYGATRISSGQKATGRQYIGQFTDDSSLSYLQARYYDSGRGQFLSEDPLFWGDPKQQNFGNPQSLNSYSYANDNPITGKDPEGLALTAAQNSQLNAIRAELLGIQAKLNGLSASNASPGTLSSLQQAINLAGGAISRIAVGANSTVSYGYQWSPPLARSNSVTDYHPYASNNGISGTPGGNDPVGGNLILTALTFTPLGDFGPDEIRGASALKVFTNHEHAAQHPEEMGLSKAVVDSAIKADIIKNGPGPVATFVSRTIDIAGKQVECHSWTSPNGIINVGTYFVRQ